MEGWDEVHTCAILPAKLHYMEVPQLVLTVLTIDVYASRYLLAEACGKLMLCSPDSRLNLKFIL